MAHPTHDHSALKRKGPLSHTTWMKLEDAVLSEKDKAVRAHSEAGDGHKGQRGSRQGLVYGVHSSGLSGREAGTQIGTCDQGSQQPKDGNSHGSADRWVGGVGEGKAGAHARGGAVRP